MKKLVVLLSAMVYVGVLSAQETYFPTNTVWRYQVDFMDDSCGKSSKKTLTYGNTQEFMGQTCHTIGGLPVISEGKKVYVGVQIFRDGSLKDTLVLLYDFGLQLGDKITWSSEIEGESITPREATVTGIETLPPYNDGQVARIIHYDKRPDDIEGVGSVEGLFAPLNLSIPTCMKETFLCCCRGSELLYETKEGVCDNAATDLQEPKTESATQKVIQTGQLFILHEGRKYSVLGIETK